MSAYSFAVVDDDGLIISQQVPADSPHGIKTSMIDLQTVPATAASPEPETDGESMLVLESNPKFELRSSVKTSFKLMELTKCQSGRAV